MRCDRCGRENPDHLSFCEDCGYNLKPARKDPGGTLVIRPVPAGPPSQGTQRPQAPPLRLGERQEPAIARTENWLPCHVCQTRNQPGHRFCVACGSPLPGDATDPATVPAVPVAPAPVGSSPVPVAAPSAAPAPPVAPAAPAAQGPSPAAMSMLVVPQPVAQPGPQPVPQPVAQPAPQAVPGSTQPLMPRPASPAATPVATPTATPIAASTATPIAASSSVPATPRPIENIRRPTMPDGVAAVAAAVARQTGDGRGEAARSEPLPAAPVVAVSEPVAKAVPSTVCSRCRTVSEVGVPYCRVCGQSLGAKSEAAPSTVAVPASPPVAASTAAPAAPSHRPALELLPEAASRTDQYAPMSAARVWGKLIQLSKDGTDGTSFPISAEQIDIGSKEGAVLLHEDPYVSPRHARLVREGGQWYVVDLGSVNGVYLRVQGRRALADGDLILLGQQVLRFEVVMEAEQTLRPAIQHGVALFGTPQVSRHARLCQRTVEGITRDVYHLYRPEVSLGRETADIVFVDDPFLSRRHAVVRQASSDKSYTLEDAGSSNGTFAAIRGREQLKGGEVIRIGLHLFRVELSDNERGGHS